MLYIEMDFFFLKMEPLAINFEMQTGLFLRFFFLLSFPFALAVEPVRYDSLSHIKLLLLFFKNLPPDVSTLGRTTESLSRDGVAVSSAADSAF